MGKDVKETPKREERAFDEEELARKRDGLTATLDPDQVAEGNAPELQAVGGCFRAAARKQPFLAGKVALQSALVLR